MLARRLLLVIALAPASAHTQDPAAPPRAVADSFFRFIAAERYLDAARLTDLDAFDAYRQEQVRYSRHTSRRMERVTPATLMTREPGMPRAVAEYQAKQLNRFLRQQPSMLEHDFGFASADSLAGVPVEVAAARWLATHDERGRMREAFGDRGTPGCPAPSRDELARLAAPIVVPVPRILGTVTDDSVAYILHDRVKAEMLLGGTDTAAVAMAGDAASNRPERARAWHAIGPATLIVRRIGSAWRIAHAVDVGSSSGWSRVCVPGEGAGRGPPAP